MENSGKKVMENKVMEMLCWLNYKIDRIIFANVVPIREPNHLFFFVSQIF